MTPEGRVKAKVNKALKMLGTDVWRFMPVQTGFGTPALDYLLCIKGRFVAVETKAPGKNLTPLQEGTKAAMEAAGGIVLVVWDETSLELAMKIILALEHAPYGTSQDNNGTIRNSLDALRAHLPEEERSRALIDATKLVAKAPDAATRRDRGAPGAQSKRSA